MRRCRRGLQAVQQQAALRWRCRVLHGLSCSYSRSIAACQLPVRCRLCCLALPLLCCPQLDELDQNAAVNKAGSVLGAFTPVADQVSTDTLAPYRCETSPDTGAAQATIAARCNGPKLWHLPQTACATDCMATQLPIFIHLHVPPCSEVFGLQRFRECELIHGRWAMLACLGALVQEGVTGDSWVAAQTLVSSCIASKLFAKPAMVGCRVCRHVHLCAVHAQTGPASVTCCTCILLWLRHPCGHVPLPSSRLLWRAC